MGQQTTKLKRSINYHRVKNKATGRHLKMFMFIVNTHPYRADNSCYKITHVIPQVLRNKINITKYGTWHQAC